VLSDRPSHLDKATAAASGKGRTRAEGRRRAQKREADCWGGEREENLHGTGGGRKVNRKVEHQKIGEALSRHQKRGGGEHHFAGTG